MPSARTRVGAKHHRVLKQKYQARVSTSPAASSGNRMRHLEQVLKASITLETNRDSEDALSVCNKQEQSRLFMLPYDIREMIFTLALTEHERAGACYEEDARYYRPGYHAPKHVYTALIETCRLAYLDFHHVPIRSTTHAFWFFDGPPGKVRTAQDFMLYFDKMTQTNLANLTHVQLFASLHWAEALIDSKLFHSFFGHRSFCPKTLTFTVRNTDWKEWGLDRSLTFDTAWVKQFLDSPYMLRVNCIELELETLSDKQNELAPITERLMQLSGKKIPVAPPPSIDHHQILNGSQFRHRENRLSVAPLGNGGRHSTTITKAEISSWSKSSHCHSRETADYIVNKFVWVRHEGLIVVDPRYPTIWASKNQKRKRERAENQSTYLSVLQENEAEFEVVKTPKKARTRRGGKRWNGAGILQSRDKEEQTQSERARLRKLKWWGQDNLLRMIPRKKDEVNKT